MGESTMRVVLACSIAFAGALYAGPAEACVCESIGRSGVCDIYEGADAVFVGTVRSSSGSEATLSVVEAFKGVTEDTITVGTSSPYDCPIVLTVGDQYLVYVGRTGTGNLAISPCLRPRRVADAGSELDILRKAVFEGKVTVSGTVRRWTQLKGPNTSDAVAAVAVTLRGGPEPLRTKTDSAGKFAFEGLPSGRYSVVLEPPPGFRLLGTSDDVVINRCGIYDLPFRIIADVSLSGTLRHLDGSDVPPDTLIDVMRVDLSPDPKYPRSLIARAKVAADGTWSIPGLTTGQYVVGVNIDRVPSPDTPYVQTFYPAAASLDYAERVTVVDGEEVRLDVRVVRPLATRIISGSVINESGIPISSRLIFRDAEDEKCDEGRIDYTDETSVGRFNHSVFVGRRYLVAAQTGMNGQLYESTVTAIPATGDVSGVVLVLGPVTRYRLCNFDP